MSITPAHVREAGIKKYKEIISELEANGLENCFNVPRSKITKYKLYNIGKICVHDCSYCDHYKYESDENYDEDGDEMGCCHDELNGNLCPLYVDICANTLFSSASYFGRMMNAIFKDKDINIALFEARKILAAIEADV
jgi:hypothetical protein